jgi:heme-degrading monooxygenase HmoA
MVIVLIHTQLRADANLVAYEQLDARMTALVQTMVGFVSVTGYASDDGDQVAMIRFTSLEALRAWREDPEHVVAQQRGRDEFYASYRIEVCEVVRAYDFKQ